MPKQAIIHELSTELPAEIAPEALAFVAPKPEQQDQILSQPYEPNQAPIPHVEVPRTLGAIAHVGNSLRRNRALTALVAASFAVGVYGNSPQESSAQESEYLGPPNAFEIARAKQEEAKKRFTGMNFLGPDSAQLKRSITSAAATNDFDQVTKVQLKRTKSPGSYTVKITQQNGRAVIPVAAFQDPQDTDGVNIKYVQLSYDGDIFTNKAVEVTPMLRPVSKNAKPRKWGKTVRLASWDNLNSSNLVREVDGEDKKDPLHVGTVKVKSKPVSAAILKSGRFYIDVSQRCAVRDQSYNNARNVCHTLSGQSYKINPRKKVNTYITGRATKPGDVISHSRKVK